MVWWKRLAPFGAASVLLVSLAPCAFGGNPDGPRGAVMLEPSVTLAGFIDHDGTVWTKHGENDDIRWARAHPEGLALLAREFDSQRYALKALTPISDRWTLGAHYAYTRFDASQRVPDVRTDEEGSAWEVSLRVRYWWNLPKSQP